MEKFTDNNDYVKDIKAIRSKRRIIMVLASVAIIVSVVLCFPINIELFGKFVIKHEGAKITSLLWKWFLIFFIELIFVAIANVPMINAMDVECNPKKHMVLNREFSRQKDKSIIYSIDLMYMGQYEEAISYAEKAIASSDHINRLVGIFNKGRCEFFLGDRQSLKITVKMYESALSELCIKKPKIDIMLKKYQKILCLMLAILNNDKEKVSELRDVEVWRNSRAVHGFIDYLKGVAAKCIDDKQEAIYYFMNVKKMNAKWVLTSLAEENLSSLN